MLILGHRGAILDQAPFHQNSFNAFREALECADGFETDACMDKEGEVFLIHEAKYVHTELGVEYCAAEHLDDKSVQFLDRRHKNQFYIVDAQLDPFSRNLIGRRRLDQLTTMEVRALRMKDGSPLVSLRQALELTGRYPGAQIDIELKGYNVVEPVLRVVKESIAQGKITEQSIFLSSFNHPALKIARQQTSHFKLGAIFVGPDQISIPLFPWWPRSAGRYTSLTEQELEDKLLKEIQPDYIIIPQEILTQETVDMVAKNFPRAQMMAWVFTEKNNLDMADLMARLKQLETTGKVAALMVDNPRQFKADYMANILNRL